MKNVSYLLGILFASLLFSVKAAAYTITLDKDNWHLVSFPKLSQERSVSEIFGVAASNGDLVAVWGFDNADKTWHSWPQKAFDVSSDLTELETSKGYWIKVQQDIELSIEGSAGNISEQILYPGWNLMGISSETEMSHEQAFAGVPFLELWSYDKAQKSFLSVKKSGGSQIILQEEFTQVKPNQGYWMYVTEQTSLVPNMGTLLPPDVDLEPLLNLTEYGKETLWETLSPGDIDWDGDGYFDFPNTQKSLSFGDFLNRQRLSITNDGNGVLSWQARMEPPVKWLLFEAFDQEGQPVLTDNVVGNVSDTNGELVLVVNRVGLASSDNYTTELVLTANGSTAEKRISVSMAVADVVGDYEVTVRLDEIDGKKADLHNPKYFLSFARDGDGIKAFLDEERSLLIPETTYLSGSYINDPESHFQVLGQLYLPKEHEHNPYSSDIRREFTLTGQRSDGRDGLSPLDIKGVYSESIYGIFDAPIQLTGEFVATRLSPIPKKKDLTVTTPVMGEIVSSVVDEGISLFQFNVTDRYSITDIKTNLRIQHSLPEQLDVSLISPKNTVIKLHQKQSRSLASVRFDDYDESVESLDLLNGQLSLGTWQLKIKNYSTTVGQLESWTMDISGAKVYKISGQIQAGIRLQLSGCGIVKTVITGQQGQFEFDGLIPCDYNITVAQLGYETTVTSVRIEGCLKSVANLCNNESDYIQNLTSDQLGQLQPKLVATSGVMKVIVSPTTSMLPRVAGELLTLQAIDVTNYSALSKTLNNRQWELYKRVNSWSAISPGGYLVDAEGYDQEAQVGKNYIAYSEDYNKWDRSSNITLNSTDILDPRGGRNAIKVSHTGDGQWGRILSAHSMGEGTFSLAKGEKLTLSVFVKEGSSDEIRFRFAKGAEGALISEIMRFTTGAFTGGQDLPSTTVALANGWYRASVTYTATEDFSNFQCHVSYGHKGQTSVHSSQNLYLFGPQCEKSNVATPYIATGFEHGVRSVANQKDALIASGTTSADIGSWSYSLDHKPSNAGMYSLKLSSEVQGTSGTETISYTTDAINIAYQNLTGYHFGIRSVNAAAGTSGMKAMDMATFDIDRPPYKTDSRGQGTEDSDSFKALVDEGTETNQSNDLFQNPEDPSQFSFVPTGMNEQSGNLNKHYRMYISTGQLIHSPPVYGGSYRLDIGVQSSEGTE